MIFRSGFHKILNKCFQHKYHIFKAGHLLQPQHFFCIVFEHFFRNVQHAILSELKTKEGLGSRQVFQINKDSAGFVWVYTHVGIDRYDGNEIKHYKLDGMVDSRDNIQSSTTMMCGPALSIR